MNKKLLFFVLVSFLYSEEINTFLVQKTKTNQIQILSINEVNLTKNNIIIDKKILNKLFTEMCFFDGKTISCSKK